LFSALLEEASHVFWSRIFRRHTASSQKSVRMHITPVATQFSVTRNSVPDCDAGRAAACLSSLLAA
jgi:hypothetical protein